MVNTKKIIENSGRKVKNFTLNLGTQYPVVDDTFRKVKQNVVGLLEFIFIGALLLGFITFMLDNQTMNYFAIFFLSNLFKTILFGSLFLILILTFKLILNNLKNYQEGFIEDLKKEVMSIFPLTICKKVFFFSSTCFLFSFVLMYFGTHRLAISVLFLGIFLLIRETKPVERWLKDLNREDLEINKIFREKYFRVFFVSRLSKVFCLTYFVFFCLFHLVDFDYLAEADSVEVTLNSIVKMIEPLYLLFLVFLNSIFIDFFLELVVVFSDINIRLLTVTSIVRRGSKAIVTSVFGIGTVGSVISVSPAVDFPGVNEFQIRYGRKYGFATSLDWLKGTILASYIDKPTMQGYAKTYGTDNILNGHSFKTLLTKEADTKAMLISTAGINELRALGLTRF